MNPDSWALHTLAENSQFFKYARIQGWCQASPIDADDIPSDKDAVRANLIPADAAEEEDAYFARVKALYPKLHDIEKVMLLQGCRPEELCVVEKHQVDIEGGFLKIEKGKTAAARRTLVLDPESMEILKVRKANAKGRYLFCSQRDPLKPLSMSTIETQQRRLKVKYVIYDFRHMFATRAAANGMSLHMLAKVLGHGDLRSVMRYVHPNQTEMDNAMRALIEVRKVRHYKSKQTLAPNWPQENSAHA